MFQHKSAAFCVLVVLTSVPQKRRAFRERAGRRPSATEPVGHGARPGRERLGAAAVPAGGGGHVAPPAAAAAAAVLRRAVAQSLRTAATAAVPAAGELHGVSPAPPDRRGRPVRCPELRAAAPAAELRAASRAVLAPASRRTRGFPVSGNVSGSFPRMKHSPD